MSFLVAVMNLIMAVLIFFTGLLLIDVLLVT